MITILALLIWTGFFAGLAYLTWKSIHHQLRFYLLIGYNALYLAGVFWMFPILRDKLG
jgi:hypothetical protein